MRCWSAWLPIVALLLGLWTASLIGDSVLTEFVFYRGRGWASCSSAPSFQRDYSALNDHGDLCGILWSWSTC